MKGNLSPSGMKSPKNRLPSAEGTNFDDDELDDQLDQFDFGKKSPAETNWMRRTWYSFKDTLGYAVNDVSIVIVTCY